MPTPKAIRTGKLRSPLYWMHYTPVQDVFRGEWSAALDHHRTVEASSLPLELQSVVLDVVGRAQLWRRERLDVARELVAHFEDGLRSERTADALIADFGSPKIAAELIRRAKLRRRPIAFRLARHAVRLGFWISGATVVFYLLLVVRFLLAGSPQMTRDFVSEHDAAIARIPVEQRAWPHYRATFLQSARRYPAIAAEALRKYDTLEWAPVHDAIAKQQDVIVRYRDASLLPHLGAFLYSPEDVPCWKAVIELNPDMRAWFPQPLQSSSTENASAAQRPSLYQLWFGSLSVLTNAGEMCKLDLLDGLNERNAKRVTDNLFALLRIARHKSEHVYARGTGSFGWNVGQVVDCVFEVLAERPELLSDRSLHELSCQLDQVDFSCSAEVQPLGPREWFEASVQKCYSADSTGNGSLVSFELFTRSVPRVEGDNWEKLAQWLMPPVLSAIAVDRRTLMKKYDEVDHQRHVIFSRPLWEAELPTAMERWSYERWTKLRFLPLAINESSITRGYVLRELATQKCDASRVAVALHRYHRAHGAFPPTLDVLVPEYLNQIPPDRHDGKPLKYRLRPDGPCLYSVGNDGDDDDGHPPARSIVMGRSGNDDAQEKAYKPYDSTLPAYRPDGDWVLYPNVN